jgi:ketosteroid isomerase-like protein
MSQQNIEVVKRGYEAFSAGDVETVMSQFDDNLEWVQPGESTISGIYRGKGEFGEYLGRLAKKAVAVRALSFMVLERVVDAHGRGGVVELGEGLVVMRAGSTTSTTLTHPSPNASPCSNRSSTDTPPNLIRLDALSGDPTRR